MRTVAPMIAGTAGTACPSMLFPIFSNGAFSQPGNVRETEENQLQYEKPQRAEGKFSIVLKYLSSFHFVYILILSLKKILL